MFEDARLSTCIFVAAKNVADFAFRIRVHPGKVIDDKSPSLVIRRDDVKLYDPENRSIVACGQDDWDLAVKIMNTGRMRRLGELCVAYQGEVNETTDGKKGNVSYDPKDGQEIIRGASICLYLVREASQGEPLYLRKEKYLAGKKQDGKAWHHRHRRVAIQESSPQNNFRRIIAATIPKDEFCNHVINYFPEPESQLPLPTLTALLNSKLADWYFRLGSTNAHVSHYQLYNLPCPSFALPIKPMPVSTAVRGAIEGTDWNTAWTAIEPLLAEPPFPPEVVSLLNLVVEQIVRIEKARGEIARTERSALAAQAQPYQDLIDRILYRTAGLTDDEARGLEERLARML